MSNAEPFERFAEFSRGRTRQKGFEDLDAWTMASRKRSRDTNDVDGHVEVTSASSSFRQTPRQKRSRVALAAERGGSVVLL